jgi:hypothetical protein
VKSNKGHKFKWFKDEKEEPQKYDIGGGARGI